MQNTNLSVDNYNRGSTLTKSFHFTSIMFLILIQLPNNFILLFLFFVSKEIAIFEKCFFVISRVLFVVDFLREVKVNFLLPPLFHFQKSFHTNYYCNLVCHSTIVHNSISSNKSITDFNSR